MPPAAAPTLRDDGRSPSSENSSYEVGTGTALVNASWSLARSAFGADIPQTAGGRSRVAVPGHSTESSARVSLHIG